MLDAASDRIVERVTSRFTQMVEAVRAGSIFAHREADTQYNHWRNRTAQRGDRSPGLTGAALERAVMSIAARNPGLVAVML